jgi:hypothetical protein
MVSDLSGRGAQWRGLGEDHLRSCRSRQKPMPVCPGRARLGPFRSCKQFPCTILATEGEHIATSAERRRALRERERRGLRRFTIGVSEDDLRVIAEHGYGGAASTDHDQQAQAVSLFITDMLAASANVTALRRCNAVSVTVSQRLQRRFQSSEIGVGAVPPPVRPAGRVVSTRRPFLTAISNLWLSGKTGFRPKRLIGREFPLAPELEANVALVPF